MKRLTRERYNDNTRVFSKKEAIMSRESVIKTRIYKGDQEGETGDATILFAASNLLHQAEEKNYIISSAPIVFVHAIPLETVPTEGTRK